MEKYTIMDNQVETHEKSEFVDPTKPISPGEIIIGSLVGLNDSGEPQVTFPTAAGKTFTAISTIAITPQHQGRQLALLFANGDLAQPIIMGVIHSPLLDLLSNVEVVDSKPDVIATNSLPNSQDESIATIDGNRVVLEGKEEIVLRCGAASITLTKTGKILITGKNLLNRASGVNRIMGGSVQVN